MFGDRIYYNSSPTSALRSGRPSTPVAARKNVKFALSSNHSSSTERLNTSFNRGKDGIFRPKSIFSLATEIDFESSSRFSRSSSASNPRLTGARQRERSVPRTVDTISSSAYSSSRNRTLHHGRSFESKSDFYSNFKENLSYLRNTSSSYYGKHGASYVPSSYQVYRFTNNYYAPKLRDRPLLSNLNLKFSSRQSSQPQTHHTSTGSTGSSHKESVSSTNSSSHNSVSSNDTLRPGLERNKFLIKFRERDLSKNVNRRSSISWDIPDINNNVSTPPAPETIEEESVSNGSAHLQGHPSDNQLARWKGSFALNADGDDELPELTCKVPEQGLIKETLQSITNHFEVLESKAQVTVPILHSSLIKSLNEPEAKPEKVKKKKKIDKTIVENTVKNASSNHSDNKITPSLSVPKIKNPTETTRTKSLTPEPKIKIDSYQVELKLEKQSAVLIQEKKSTNQDCSVDKTKEPTIKQKQTGHKSKLPSNQSNADIKSNQLLSPVELKTNQEASSLKKGSNKTKASDNKTLTKSLASEPKLKDDACQVEPKLEKQSAVLIQETKSANNECSISSVTVDKTKESTIQSKPTSHTSKVPSNQSNGDIKSNQLLSPVEIKTSQEVPSVKKELSKNKASDNQKIVQSLPLVSIEKNQSPTKANELQDESNQTVNAINKLKSLTPEPIKREKKKTSEVEKSKNTQSPQTFPSTIETGSQLNVAKTECLQSPSGSDKVSKKEKLKNQLAPKSSANDTKPNIIENSDKQTLANPAPKKAKVKKTTLPSSTILEPENKSTLLKFESKSDKNNSKDASPKLLEPEAKVTSDAQAKSKPTGQTEIKLDVTSKSKLDIVLKPKEPSPPKSPTTKSERKECSLNDTLAQIPKKSKSKVEVATASKEKPESALMKKSKSVKKIKAEESKEVKLSIPKDISSETVVVSMPKKKLAKAKAIVANVEHCATPVHMTSCTAVKQQTPKDCLELKLPPKPVEPKPETKVSKVVKKKKKESTTEDNAEKSVKKKKKIKASTELISEVKSEVTPTILPKSPTNDTQAGKENQKPYRKSKTDTLGCSQTDQPKPVSKKPQKIRFREYTIDDFVFLTVLGRGSFGKVLLAELRNHEHYFAIKCLKKHTVIEDDDVESIMIERKVLAFGSNNPFICKLFCTFQTEDHLFFAMEWCAGGDLMFHVQKEGKFSEDKARFYAAEMVCALWFLHKRGIIYRDLKLDNVMIANDGHIRLVDFGMCIGKMYREELLPSNFCGTPEYMAPEIVKGIKYNNSVDWWALGVVIYEMCVGSSPFQGTDEDELLWNVCNTDVHYPRFLSTDVKNLCSLLMKKNPAERMGMPTCLQGDITSQAWFQGIKWKAFEECKIQPPFIPELVHEADVSYFDQYFTKEEPCITPCNKPISDKDQQLFEGFNYTNPNLTE